MGLLTDFVVASSKDALQYESHVLEGTPIPPDRFQHACYKNFTPLAVEMLWASLRGEPWDVERHSLEHVYHTGDGETWLERFPDELVHRLSALNEADQDQVADAWARAEEEVPGNSEELRPVLRDLHQLAIHAQKTGRSMYLWGSL
jgi:hypothetical protein